MKNATNTRIQTTFFFSSNFLTAGAIRSSVIVDEDVRTRLESVDIDAESTSTRTMPIIRSLSREESIDGIMLS